MGMHRWSTPHRVKELKARLIGPWEGTQDGLGIVQGILSLFMAQLYISKCKKTGQPKDEEEIKNNLSKFGVNARICDPGASDYYSNGKSFWWNQTDLLILACRPTLYRYLRSGDATSQKIAQLILDP